MLLVVTYSLLPTINYDGGKVYMLYADKLHTTHTVSVCCMYHAPAAGYCDACHTLTWEGLGR